MKSSTRNRSKQPTTYPAVPRENHQGFFIIQRCGRYGWHAVAGLVYGDLDGAQQCLERARDRKSLRIMAVPARMPRVRP